MGNKTRRKIEGTIFYIVLALILFMVAFPFVYMVLSSLKNNVDIFNPAKTFNFIPTIKNYIAVFNRYNFGRPLFNTIWISTSSTVLSLILGVPAAYAIARYKQRKFSLVILAVRVIPGIAFLVPWYLIFTKLGLAGSYTSLILCQMLVSLPYIVWIMIPTFEALPRELEESAKVDGCITISAFFRVLLPVSLPGLITATILVFITAWNNFIFGMILGGATTKPLAVAILGFISNNDVNWGGLMAACCVITFPVILITLVLQKYIIAGLTAGAVKG